MQTWWTHSVARPGLFRGHHGAYDPDVRGEFSRSYLVKTRWSVADMLMTFAVSYANAIQCFNSGIGTSRLVEVKEDVMQETCKKHIFSNPSLDLPQACDFPIRRKLELELTLSPALSHGRNKPRTRSSSPKCGTACAMFAKSSLEFGCFGEKRDFRCVEV